MELKTIAQIFQDPLKNIFRTLTDETQHLFSNRILEYQVEEYKRNSFCKTILHRTDPKLLDSFYEPLYLCKEEGPQAGKRVATNSVTELFKLSSFITIIGHAGSGKSTLVKYLFKGCFEEKFKIPIRIELRYLNDYNGNLLMYIHEEIFKFNKLGVTQSTIDRLLDSNSFAFFLDGYDEVNRIIKNKVTIDIEYFVKRYPSNYYLITSRPYAGIDMFPSFTNYLVTKLETSEIESFIKRQIPLDQAEVASKIINTINSHEANDYSTFISNPLLLSMFILTYQSYSSIPQKRSQFYYQVFDTLFSAHDSLSKLSYVREKISGLSKEQFEQVLRVFSFIAYFEGRWIFTLKDIISIWTIIKEKKSITFENDSLLHDLCVSIGILVKDGVDYLFPHRSLQEYFTAAYIGDLSVENKRRLYERLRRMNYENEWDILEREHFYHLLSELDYYYLARFLALPLLRNIHDQFIDEMQKIDSESKVHKLYYSVYGKYQLVLNILLKAERNFPDIFEDLIPNKVNYQYKDISKDYVSLDTKVENETNYKLLSKAVNIFRSQGKELISSIERIIVDIDSVDNEIIDMI